MIDQTPNAKKFAQAVVDMFEESGLNGIADEMTYSQIDTANKYWDVFLEASAYLGLPLYQCINNREQNIAFRKAWDEAFEEGERRKRERSQELRREDPVG